MFVLPWDSFRGKTKRFHSHRSLNAEARQMLRVFISPIIIWIINYRSIYAMQPCECGKPRASDNNNELLSRVIYHDDALRFFFSSIAPKLTWMLIIENDDRLRYGSSFGNVDATTMRTFSLVSHKSSRGLKKTDLHRIKENQSCFVKRETFSRVNEPMPIGVTICLSSDYGYREGRKTNIWSPSKCARDCVKFVSDVFLRLFLSGLVLHSSWVGWSK